MKTYEKQEYARVVWRIEDVMDLFEVTEDRAHEFLCNNERNMQDRMVEYGWQVLETCGEMEDLKRKEI
jgi:hypothetical protein